MQARSSLEDAIESSGLLQTYSAIDLARQALWCRDTHCRHKADVPVIGQAFGDEGIEQLWCRARIAGLMGSQRVILASLGLIGLPEADRRADDNHRLLRDALSEETFDVDVWSSVGGADDDGRVGWTRPLTVVLDADDHGGERVTLEPGCAPLEIGYTLPSRTLSHLVYDGGVWRWPYGSQELWLLAAVERQGDRLRLRGLNHDFDLADPSESTSGADSALRA